MAAVAAERKAWLFSGLLLGLGYLCHPLALLSVPALAMWALLRHRDLRSFRRLVRPAGIAGAGLLVPLLVWRLVNRGHYAQGGFLSYAASADGVYGGGPGAWLLSRTESLADSLVPFAIPVFSADNRSVSAVEGHTPWVVHVFLGYWNSLPFGLGLLAFPVVLHLLWTFARRWPWYGLWLIAMPFLLFLVYWGATVTGLLREGLHPWVMTVVTALAWVLSTPGRPVGRLTRVLMTLRPVEALVMMVVPVIATTGLVVDRGFRATDVLAMVLMVGSTMGLALVTWRVLSAGPAFPAGGLAADDVAARREVDLRELVSY
jgi:hypothetical protein